MPKSIPRTYSRYSRDAVTLLGALIREARKERKLTAQELADRAGISRSMLEGIEGRATPTSCNNEKKVEKACLFGAYIAIFTTKNRDIGSLRFPEFNCATI
ncbi:hypothetical protein DSCO28_22910 [Desulfosarcina ovata subsp. sediminis]|uniref:HTH cro/C1-type domain-containing protein n=1 Tax=Desulfosarcina ovata subsp. sediminis TaxID=885957 RepID=A0A5K7ZMT3_9BACT|nr:helix-turn-helix transcriptional regulator [Desulfosarcina ovata]BBO81725.1 hypothetical protein DSCO28_22910 [Desulfosarcina ovata subsp. sediminis]